MMSVLLKKFNNLSIRYKIFLSYLGLVTMLICLFLVINLYFTTKDSETRTLYSLRQALNQTGSFLEFKAQSVKSVLDMLALNDSVQKLVSKESGVYLDNIGFWIGDNSEFSRTVFYTTQNNPSISKIHLYMKSGLAATADSDDYILLSTVVGKEWYKKLESSGDKLEWVTQEEIDQSAGSDSISAVRKIPSDQDINGFIGIIRADIPIDSIKTTLEQSLFSKSTLAFLINSDNRILCMSENAVQTGNAEFAYTLGKLKASPEGSIWTEAKLNNRDYLLAGQPIQYTDWKLILAVPYRDILESGLRTRNQMFLIFLCVIPLTLPLSFLVSGSVTKRIRKLISHMKKAEKGNFDIPILASNEDEVGQMTRSFNQMLAKMALLIDDQFKLGREIKNAEIKALQAQINPHFLYNTLDLINWMSMKYKAEEIRTLVESLSKFYKLSLNKGKDIVSIEDELNHVRSYVMIQNMRFSDSIHLKIAVGEELFQYSILKIILQPLVENAILHGILEKDEEEGEIVISGELKDGVITLKIRDDGIGMSEETLQDIPGAISPKDSHGYGIRNIDERIRLNYGSEYGLSYHSTPGVGTTVEVRIPALKYNGETGMGT
jgi:two-component system sensor histidine kinase YesM